jgi:hypothetical protein
VTATVASVGKAVGDAAAGEARRASVSPERTSSSLPDGEGAATDPTGGEENPVSRLVETVDSPGSREARQLVETGVRQLEAVGSSTTDAIGAINGMTGLKGQLEHLLAALPAAAAIAASGSAQAPLADPPSLRTGSRSLIPQDLDRVSPRTSGGGDPLRNTTPLSPKAIAASGSSSLGRGTTSLGRGTKGIARGETASQWRRDGESFGSRPVDQPDGPLPLQAPMPPAGSAEGHGGTSFIPLVALLALLALVAPTTLRGRGREADFRPPVPFVCALERPG